ncbi:hypothetical protein BJV82DRAFT_661805 [Fennellomyces sp. T-0311]|nr:hypothetical protein BJV82DRAFT_661805 [Fennellomyces sp. T-0311]
MKITTVLGAFAIFVITVSAVPIPDGQQANGNNSEGKVTGVGNNFLKGGIGNKKTEEIVIYQCNKNSDDQQANNNNSEGDVTGVSNNLFKDGFVNDSNVKIRVIQGCPAPDDL